MNSLSCSNEILYILFDINKKKTIHYCIYLSGNEIKAQENKQIKIKNFLINNLNNF